MSDLRFRCSTCKVVNACKQAFGAYWETHKSSGGVGCNYPVSPSPTAAGVVPAKKAAARLPWQEELV